MNKHWTKDDLLSLSRAYQGGALLQAGAELDLFSPLARRPHTCAELARSLQMPTRPLQILLDALAALDLLDKQDDRYHLPHPLANLLAESSPDNLLGALRHQANCARRWHQLARVVLQGRCEPHQPSVNGSDADQQAFIAAMHTFSDAQADALVARLKPLHCRHILDIGGASGTWTMALLRAAPHAKATLFDLPPVIPLAQQRLRNAGFDQRAACVGGDYYHDELPGGADFAWLSAIVHQNSRSQNRELFAKIHRALHSGGQLVIRDVVMQPCRTEPVAGALFAVNMLVSTDAGATFTLDELRDDLHAAAFANVELLYRDEFMNSLLRAQKK